MDSHETPQRGVARFWPARCGSFSKELLLLTLLGGFLLQTLLVYTDVHDTVPLSERALSGRRLWHQNNCQTCHQFHGFGGFLGPDLTNITERLDRSTLAAQLVVDDGQMPFFEMSNDEVDALWAFLVAMNETGQGQARNPNLAAVSASASGGESGSAGDDSSASTGSDTTSPDDSPKAANPGDSAPVGQGVANTPAAAVKQVVDELNEEQVNAGFALFHGRNCLTCHVYFGRSAIGAPDLSRSGATLTDDELKTVLANGRPPRMPLPALSAREQKDVFAFIRFMAQNRADALGRVVEEPGSFWGSLPWWEYR